MKQTIIILLSLLLFNTAKAQKSTDKVFKVKGVTFVMKYVQGGTFKMGATKEQKVHDSDELPVQNVKVKSFYMGETEVTQELWLAVMGGKNPSKQRLPNHPVEWITWDQCKEFISKLNSMLHLNFRLPTEAEWEYAARGGRYSKGYQYAGGNNINKVSWNAQNAENLEKKHQEVKTKAPNELGIYDMSGNVSEWCENPFYNYGEDPMKPAHPITLYGWKIIRGGAYNSSPQYLRVANRHIYESWRHDDNLGFRLAL